MLKPDPKKAPYLFLPGSCMMYQPILDSRLRYVQSVLNFQQLVTKQMCVCADGPESGAHGL